MAEQHRNRLRKSDIAKLALWTVIANGFFMLLLAVGGFLLAPEDLRASALQRIAELAGIDQGVGKGGLAVTYVAKSGDSDVEGAQKSSLNLTLVGKFVDDEVSEETETEFVETDSEQAFGSEAFEEVKAMAIQPILMQKPGSGSLEIGSFKPIVVSGNADTCVDLGHSMLMEAKAQKKLLQVMVESDAITIAKICTKNGSIFLTCRSNQITISPRKSRPDDGC
jgi:hypothetical protein